MERLPQITEIVVPLLTTIDNSHWILPNLRNENWKIVDLYPSQIFALLYTVLPENAEDWPYEIGEVLGRIHGTDGGLRQDERLVELIRKWKAR